MFYGEEEETVINQVTKKVPTTFIVIDGVWTHDLMDLMEALKDVRKLSLDKIYIYEDDIAEVLLARGIIARAYRNRYYRAEKFGEFYDELEKLYEKETIICEKACDTCKIRFECWTNE